MLEWLHSYLLNQLQGTAQPSACHGVLNSAGHMTGTILTISHFPFCLALSIQSPIFRSHTIQQGMHRDASQAGGIVHLRVILCFPLSSRKKIQCNPSSLGKSIPNILYLFRKKNPNHVAQWKENSLKN